jgi:hypothetical protein
VSGVSDTSVTADVPFYVPGLTVPRTSELAAALVAALAELTVVEKAHKANAGSYSYDYADLGDLVKMTRPVLASHGLVARTPVHGHGDEYAVTVKFIHTSGETMDDDPLPFPRGKDAQSSGSWITYFRRYALLSALGMATGDDDDGAKAIPAADPVPGFRRSLIDAVAKLSEAERGRLRDWLKEEELPDRPALMTEAQCALVVDWLVDGMPKDDA